MNQVDYSVALWQGNVKAELHCNQELNFATVSIIRSCFESITQKLKQYPTLIQIQ